MTLRPTAASIGQTTVQIQTVHRDKEI